MIEQYNKDTSLMPWDSVVNQFNINNPDMKMNYDLARQHKNNAIRKIRKAIEQDTEFMEILREELGYK